MRHSIKAWSWRESRIYVTGCHFQKCEPTVIKFATGVVNIPLRIHIIFLNIKHGSSQILKIYKGRDTLIRHLYNVSEIILHKSIMRLRRRLIQSLQMCFSKLTGIESFLETKDYLGPESTEVTVALRVLNVLNGHGTDCDTTHHWVARASVMVETWTLTDCSWVS